METSWPICMAVGSLLLAVIGMGLWIDWKLNWRKGRHAPRQARGFEVFPTSAAPPRDESGPVQKPPDGVDA